MTTRGDWRTGGLTREGIESYAALVRALDRLEREGITTPCQRDPGPWLAEDYRERREAATACAWCPVVAECAAYADVQPEHNNVWGGRDRTPQQRKATTEKETADARR